MNLDIDVTKAKSWKKDVDQELAEVKKLLKDVAKACDDNPADDDILMAIQDTGRFLDEKWNGLCNGFEESMGFIDKTINEIERSIKNSVERFENFKSGR